MRRASQTTCASHVKPLEDRTGVYRLKCSSKAPDSSTPNQFRMSCLHFRYTSGKGASYRRTFLARIEVRCLANLEVISCVSQGSMWRALLVPFLHSWSILGPKITQPFSPADDKVVGSTESRDCIGDRGIVLDWTDRRDVPLNNSKRHLLPWST